MKKYFVIGNPINHSLSPKLHNYWLKENKIDAIYDKKKIEEKNLQTIISEVKEKKINGINVTVPFKRAVIPYLDRLSPEAEQTQSVNTIILSNDNLVGHNTDILGFDKAIKNNFPISPVPHATSINFLPTLGFIMLIKLFFQYLCTPIDIKSFIKSYLL